MPKNTAKGGGWVTINGVHVFIESGKVTKGPAKFIGSSVDDLPSGQSVEDKKAALKAKYAGKTGSSATQEAKPDTSTTKSDSSGKSENAYLNSLKEKYKNKTSGTSNMSEQTKKEVESASAEVGKSTKGVEVYATTIKNGKLTREKLQDDTAPAPSAKPGLQVTHYDGPKGSRNEYRLVNPDGTSKKISASQAKEMFPDDPATKGIKTRSSSKSTSSDSSSSSVGSSKSGTSFAEQKVGVPLENISSLSSSSYRSGNITFKNDAGDLVEVYQGRVTGTKATIFHPNGTTSVVYADSSAKDPFKNLAQKVNDPSNSYNRNVDTTPVARPKFDPSTFGKSNPSTSTATNPIKSASKPRSTSPNPSTGNKAFDNATSTTASTAKNPRKSTGSGSKNEMKSYRDLAKRILSK